MVLQHRDKTTVNKRNKQLTNERINRSALHSGHWHTDDNRHRHATQTETDNQLEHYRWQHWIGRSVSRQPDQSDHEITVTWLISRCAAPQTARR